MCTWMSSWPAAGEGAQETHPTKASITKSPVHQIHIQCQISSPDHPSHRHHLQISTQSSHLYHWGVLWYLNDIIQHKIAIHRNARYQEFVFREETEVAVSHRTSRLETTGDYYNTKPMLEHFKQYLTMQQNMIKSLLTINTNIIGIHKKHGSYTPKLTYTIIKNRGG